MSRRARNEGCIYHRSDGRWEARVTVDATPASGPRRQSLYGRTQKEVREKLRRLLHDHEPGTPTTLDYEETLGAYLEHWLETEVAPNRRPSTYAAYSTAVRKHLSPGIGHVPLPNVTPQDVQQILARGLSSGLSPRTVQLVRCVLRTALTHAVRIGYLQRNAAALTAHPTVRPFRSTPLTPEQVRQLLRGLEDARNGALYTTAVFLGLRSAELRGLRWRDVDFDKRILRIDTTVQKVDGCWKFVEPKTDGSRRSLYLPDSVLNALRSQSERVRGESDRIGGLWQELDLVFPSRRGTPLDPSNLTHAFQRQLEELGLPRQRLHDLRHACATLLLSEGVELVVIKQILGHTRIAMTADLYAHVLPAVGRDALVKMDRLLGDAA